MIAEPSAFRQSRFERQREAAAAKKAAKGTEFDAAELVLDVDDPAGRRRVDGSVRRLLA